MTEQSKAALADALDYFRPHRLTGDGATIILTAGKMREHLAVIEAELAALRSEAGADMREAAEFGLADEASDEAMAYVDRIGAAALFSYAPDGSAELTWGARRDIGQIVEAAMREARRALPFQPEGGDA